MIYNTFSVAWNPKLFEEQIANPDKGIWYVPGGSDIDPSLYGEENRQSHHLGDIDHREVALVRKLLEIGYPLLGICRGHQIINVAAGGTLWQDIYVDGVIDEPFHWHHTVNIYQGSILEQIFQPKNRILRANSLHHQAIRKLAPGWRTSAEHGGVIESIENPEMPWVVTAQWHPEMLNQVPDIVKYLERFL